VLRVLLPEGSSLSAREAVASLGALGCRIDILDPNPFCICRFSRYVENVFRSPRLSDSPEVFEAFLLAHIAEYTYDVVLAVHEHAFLIAAVADAITARCAVAIAPFSAFELVQSKVRFFELAAARNLPRPPTTIVASPADFPLGRAMPYYVKTAFGTAGDGTWRVESNADRLRVITELKARRASGNLGRFLIQDVVPGTLEVVQTVFAHGALVASHTYRQRIAGVGGSASGRVSVVRPEVTAAVRELGESLDWHGALMIDYIWNDSSSEFWFIDPNPRPGETMNACLAGVNLMQAMLSVSQGISPARECAKDGVRSHILLTALLACAIQQPNRRAVLQELFDALRHRGLYEGSLEEVASTGIDWLSILPTAVVALRLLARPQSARAIATQAIGNYALSESAATRIAARYHSSH
jgi:predicted ATP-grasp superfamily ATP-dependent carboligase